jgi:hypothetical protein
MRDEVNARGVTGLDVRKRDGQKQATSKHTSSTEKLHLAYSYPTPSAPATKVSRSRRLPLVNAANVLKESRSFQSVAYLRIDEGEIVTHGH